MTVLRADLPWLYSQCDVRLGCCDAVIKAERDAYGCVQMWLLIRFYCTFMISDARTGVWEYDGLGFGGSLFPMVCPG